MLTAPVDRPMTIVAVCTLVLVGSCAETSNRAWAPEEANVVFMSSRDGDAEIYSCSGGSTEWTNLTRSPAAENWPQWSPDGRLIAYQSNSHGNLDVWVMNADGSNPRRLTDNTAHDYVPAWSPDGSRITFASWRREPGDTTEAVHIYVMNADGSEQRRLFSDSPGTSTSAHWAPDGQSYLLSRKVEEPGTDVFIVDVNGSVIRRLTNDAYSNGAAVFSPDGKRVAFYSDRGEESDIVVISADGSDRRTVVSGGQNWYPRWSPDGRWLVYTANVSRGADEDLDIYAVQVDGEASPIRLASSPGREAEGQWQPR